MEQDEEPDFLKEGFQENMTKRNCIVECQKTEEPAFLKENFSGSLKNRNCVVNKQKT